MVKSINSFHEVELTKEKTLVICDIDETLLYYPGIESKCNVMIKDLKNILTEREFKRELNEIKIMYRTIVPPKHTDLDGFINMKNKLTNLNGKLIFLTARCKEYDNFTKNQILKVSGLKDEFEIHYTNNQMSKGEYIKNNIPLELWEQVIFIDDMDSSIESVLQLDCNIQCYKFVL